VQQDREWWQEERQAERRGWLVKRTEKRWEIDKWVATITPYVDCRVEGVLREPNQGQGYESRKHLRNNQCPNCQSNQKEGQWAISREEATRVQCATCRKDDAIPERLPWCGRKLVVKQREAREEDRKDLR